MTRIRPFAIALVAILALGAGAKTITVKGPNDDGGVFAVSADTHVMNDAKAIKFGDLKKGWGVVVNWDYASVESKLKVAKLIEVTDAP